MLTRRVEGERTGAFMMRRRGAWRIVWGEQLFFIIHCNYSTAVAGWRSPG